MHRTRTAKGKQARLTIILAALRGVYAYCRRHVLIHHLRDACCCGSHIQPAASAQRRQRTARRITIERHVAPQEKPGVKVAQ